MTIERFATETVIRIPQEMMTYDEVQDLLDYLFFREMTSKSTATQADADYLANLVNKNWFETNANTLLENENHR